jgi:hypothetical protein
MRIKESNYKELCNDYHNKGCGGRKEDVKKMKDAHASFSILCSAFLHPMSNNTQDNDTTLAILQMADEDMLRMSGNPVYFRLKAELDCLR